MKNIFLGKKKYIRGHLISRILGTRESRKITGSRILMGLQYMMNICAIIKPAALRLSVYVENYTMGLLSPKILIFLSIVQVTINKYQK